MAFRLLDTNIVSFTFNNHSLAATYQRHLTGFDLAISFQTLGELLEGVTLVAWGPARWARLQVFLTTFTVLDSTQDVWDADDLTDSPTA